MSTDPKTDSVTPTDPNGVDLPTDFKMENLQKFFEAALDKDGDTVNMDSYIQVKKEMELIKETCLEFQA